MSALGLQLCQTFLAPAQGSKFKAFVTPTFLAPTYLCLYLKSTMDEPELNNPWTESLHRASQLLGEQMEAKCQSIRQEKTAPGPTYNVDLTDYDPREIPCLRVVPSELLEQCWECPRLLRELEKQAAQSVCLIISRGLVESSFSFTDISTDPIGRQVPRPSCTRLWACRESTRPSRAFAISRTLRAGVNDRIRQGQ